ncbi:hypothetical protein Pmani_037643, partial [Petrolisthes manimaculis]
SVELTSVCHRPWSSVVVVLSSAGNTYFSFDVGEVIMYQPCVNGKHLNVLR